MADILHGQVNLTRRVRQANKEATGDRIDLLISVDLDGALS